MVISKFLFLSYFFYLTLSQQSLIVDPKSLTCYVDKVQFTLTKNVSIKMISVPHSNCSIKVPKYQRTLSFSYRDCESTISYLRPYGALTKMNFIAELMNGEIVEFATQCFFDDIVGWSTDDFNDQNKTLHDEPFRNPSDVKGAVMDEWRRTIKSAKLGQRLTFNIHLSDSNYQTFLPFNCKFSGYRDKDDKSDLYFMQDGCPHKMAGFVEDLKRESSTSYSLPFNAFQLGSARTLYIKCLLIKLCPTENDGECLNTCRSHQTATNRSSLSTVIRTKNSKNQDVNKITWFRTSVEIKIEKTGSISVNSTVLIFSLLVTLLIVIIIIQTLLLVKLTKHHRKSHCITQKFLLPVWRC